MSRRCCWGDLCAVTLSAVITVPDWETARADLLIGMQYETTGLDLDAVPGWLAALVMLHQNFPLDGWAWGPAAAGLAVLLCWVRGQREAKPKRTELVLSIVFGIAEVLGLSICKLGSWAFVFKNSVSALRRRVLHGRVRGAVLPRGLGACTPCWAAAGRAGRTSRRPASQRGSPRHRAARRRCSSARRGCRGSPCSGLAPWTGTPGGQISQVLGVQEMTAHHTVLSTWLHGWLFRLGRALGSDNLGVFLYIVLQFLVCAWVFGQVTAFAARLGCSRGVQYAVTAFFALDPRLGRVHPDAGQGYALHGTVRPVRAVKPPTCCSFRRNGTGSRPRLTAYAVLGVLCCLLREKRHLCRCADAAGVGLHRE